MPLALITLPCPWCAAPMVHDADTLATAARAEAPLLCDTCGMKAGAVCTFELVAYRPPLDIHGEGGLGLAADDDVVTFGGGE